MASAHLTQSSSRLQEAESTALAASEAALTFSADAQGRLAGRPGQLSPKFLDSGLHFILVPGEFPKSQDLHVGQQLTWDGRRKS